MQPKRSLSEYVEHLSRGPLAGLHPSVEIPLAVRRGVFPGEQRVPLGLIQESPEVGVLAGSEPGIRAVHPRIVRMPDGLGSQEDLRLVEVQVARTTWGGHTPRR
jgi:hypothetical protein